MFNSISVLQTLFILPILGAPIVFPFIFSGMAKRRGLSVAGWVIVGLMPGLNWFGFLALLCIRPDSQRS
ncbi:MAG: hypothetical protein AB8F65_14800 [Woeseiaceae bacterium]